MSLEAAAALMCKLGCLTELLQSRARANVPTDLKEMKPSLNSACKPSVNINTQATLWDEQTPFPSYKITWFGTHSEPETVLSKWGLLLWTLYLIHMTEEA